MSKSLDKVLKEKVEPIVDDAMHKFLGITIEEMRGEISDKIEKNRLISYNIDTSLDFKLAKKMFKREFLKRLLQTHLGNITAVAKVSGLDRRTIHRDIKQLNIDIKKMRDDLVQTKYYQKEAVYGILRQTLDDYKEVINPGKLEKMYKNADLLSERIVDQLPSIDMTWSDAEKEFEKTYLTKALSENNFNITKTAEDIGLRYETLHRKIKHLGLMSSGS